MWHAGGGENQARGNSIDDGYVGTLKYAANPDIVVRRNSGDQLNLRPRHLLALLLMGLALLGMFSSPAQAADISIKVHVQNQLQDAKTGKSVKEPIAGVKVVITGADGASVAFAHVEVTPLPSGEARMETAMNGSYRITGLAPGSYRVHAETMAGPPGADDQPRRSAPCQVDLGKGERKSLDLLVK